MDKAVFNDVHRALRQADTHLSGLSPEAVATLVSSVADIVLVLDQNDRIVDLSYGDRDLKAWNPDGWIGKAFVDTVTVESREKVLDLVNEAVTGAPTRGRQVNHPAAGQRDLPVSYRIVGFLDRGTRLAIGHDLRANSDMQQRLVRAQMEMEKDYRKLRDVESRYRILFHLAFEPMIVADAQSLRILDANEGAAALLGRPVKKLAGAPAVSVFARDDQQEASEQLVLAAGRGRQLTFSARTDSAQDPVSVRVTPFRELGRTNLMISIGAAGAPAVPASASDAIFAAAEALPDGLVFVDPDGIVKTANAAFLDLVRVVSAERIEGKRLDNWLGGSTVDLQVLMANLKEHGIVRRFSSVVRDALGGTETVEISAARAGTADEPLYVFSVREGGRHEPAPQMFGSDPQSGAQFTALVGRVPLKDLVRETADIIEKLCIEAALRLTDNNRASAADMLGLSRQSLYIKLKRYGIDDGEDSRIN